MQIVRRFIWIALVLCASAGVVHAHHSGSMFDAGTEMKISGVVKEFQLTNPHAWLLVGVSSPNGESTTWSVELGAPTLIQGMGIGKSTFKGGDEVTVTFHPMKDGRPAGEFISATLSDGTVIGH